MNRTDRLLAIVLELQRRGRLRAADLAANEGVLVLEVRPGGPAERASLKMLDLIIALDGEPVRSVDDIQRVLGGKATGAPLRVGFLRDEKRREVTAVL